MPALTGTVVANYLKTQPSSQFGTRNLAVLKVAIDGVFTNYAAADSLFSKSVRAIQQTAELYAVFTPVNDTTDYFHVIVASDTQWSGDSANQGVGGVASNGGYGILETAIAAGNGNVAATVTAAAGFVAAPQYGA